MTIFHCCGFNLAALKNFYNDKNMLLLTLGNSEGCDQETSSYIPLKLEHALATIVHKHEKMGWFTVHFRSFTSES